MNLERELRECKTLVQMLNLDCRSNEETEKNYKKSLIELSEKNILLAESTQKIKVNFFINDLKEINKYSLFQRIWSKSLKIQKHSLLN